MTLYDDLLDAGYAFAEVDFEGGNDDGGVTRITVYDAANTPFELPWATYDYSWNPETREHTRTLKPGVEPPIAALREALQSLVYDHYGSFAGEFHVYGTVTVDAKARTTVMSGRESYESYDTFERDLDLA